MSAQNWFVALPVTAGPWFSALPPVPTGFRSFHPEDLHITVAFFGPVGERAARAGWEAARWTVGAVDASLGSVVPMGDPRRYSALSALLVQGREVVEAEIGAFRAPALAAAGAAPDRYAPKAHLTLARPMRSAGPSERAAGLTWAAALDLTEVRVRLDRIALYTWDEARTDRLFRVVVDRSS